MNPDSVVISAGNYEINRRVALLCIVSARCIEQLDNV